MFRQEINWYIPSHLFLLLSVFLIHTYTHIRSWSFSTQRMSAFGTGSWKWTQVWEQAFEIYKPPKILLHRWFDKRRAAAETLSMLDFLIKHEHVEDNEKNRTGTRTGGGKVWKKRMRCGCFIFFIVRGGCLREKERERDDIYLHFVAPSPFPSFELWKYQSGVDRDISSSQRLITHWRTLLNLYTFFFKLVWQFV